MTLADGMNSPAWTAAGWTMVHLGWIGASIGLAFVAARRLLGAASPEARHGVAVAGLALWTASPFAAFGLLYRPMPDAKAADRVAVAATVGAAPMSLEVRPAIDRRPDIALDRREGPGTPGRPRFEGLVDWLPGVWLAGSLTTLGLLLAGVAGVERLRRSGVRVEDGPVADCCERLRESLGVARRVGVAACGRVVTPVLVGVVRPLILLPPAALSGWTMDQVEMALLHELAHLRRRDNLVALAQRLAEALLFFHPLTWWLSAWIGLERELCCDRLVVDRTGRRHAYAELLAGLAGAGPGAGRTALAMAEHPLTTRIRWILDKEERSMRLTLTEGIGLVLAAVLGGTLTLATYAVPPPKDAREAAGNASRQALRRMADEVAATPVSGKDEDGRGNTLVGIAKAQVKLGDRDGALATLRLLEGLSEGQMPKLGGKIDARAWHRVSSVVSSLEVRRDAGDVDGARAALKRIVHDFRVFDDKVVRGAYDKVTRLMDEGIVAKSEPQRQVSDEEAAYLAEASIALIDQAIALGETGLARNLIHRAVDAVGPPQGPTKAIIVGILGNYLVKAGDRADGRELLERSRRASVALKEPKARSAALSFLAQSQFEAGELDEPLALAGELPPEDMQRVYAGVLAGLADESNRGFWWDPAGMNIKIGSPWLRPKDRARARHVLPRIAAAVRATGDARTQARTLVSIVSLQARAGDVAGALATAESSPDLRRADFPGPSDGYYDALKPVAFALVASAMADAGDADSAASTFAKAEVLARAIGDEGQKIVAQIVIAEQEASSRRSAALAVAGEAIATALMQPEPRRSRALTMLAAVQIGVGDISAAERTIDAMRDNPGLEKARALSILVSHLEKEGDRAAARSAAGRALAMLEAKLPDAPEPPRNGVMTMQAIGRDTFLDFDKELPPPIAAHERKGWVERFRARSLDAPTVIRLAKELPAERRDAALTQIAGTLATSGDAAGAMDAARAIESPSTRMAAFSSLAYAIPLSRDDASSPSRR
ncbi:Regulatory protein BlaR1 (plasmid) [Aquisphaera giovannonii]|uniref:Regulatory protein BlaR1 n=1 Tax=Aquisphaera giovannonii TaxID=406548 RepID=A0A5B9WF96_9BACT|nr:M56 family metallopeptidase [Aquisphaera giovannonii]QEH39252.1 Regulatory protein BlaR1 [Aquisphaera giovannonii]